MTSTTQHGGRLRTLSFATLAVSLAGLGLLIGLGLLSDQQVTGIAGMVTALATAATAIATPLLRNLESTAEEPADRLLKAADTLAEALTKQWERAARERQLTDSAPIPVRWRWSTRSLTGSVKSAVDPRGHHHFPPLPGMPPVTSGMVASGGLRDLFGIYAGLGSGRLVVLGGPGTGKSAAGILLLLDALQHRGTIRSDEERANVPVPVLLTVHGWNPRTESLDRWLATRLMTDFASLLPGKADPELALDLVREKRISLFLDGFDEMGAEFREPALLAINQQLDFRLVLLTRIREFADAVDDGHVQGAAAVDLQPVRGPDAADYLAESQRQPLQPPWQRLVDHLREQPDSPLTLALDSPLMLTLVADTLKRGSEIEDLLIPGRFRTEEEVKTHLLDRVLPAAYRDQPGKPPARYHPDHAQRWLSGIAARMKADGPRDLAWWQLRHWAPKLPRILATAVVVGVPVSLAVWLAIDLSNVGESNGTDVLGPVIGPLTGLVVGVTVGLVMEYERPTGQRSGRWQVFGGRFNWPIALLAGTVAALVVGLVVSGHGRTLLALVAGPGVGLICWLAVGLASGTGPADPQRTARSRAGALLSRFSPLAGVACGLPVAAVISFAPAPPADAPAAASGWEYGVAFGLALAVGIGLLDGFAAPRVGATVPTDPADSWRRDLHQSLGLGLSFGLAMGLIAGIGITSSSGWRSGLLAAGAIGAVAHLVAGVAVSKLWQTRLIFLQLWLRGEAPPRGLHFLRDAHERGVLRIVGPVYQFRHALLQDKLADSYTSGAHAGPR